MKNKLIVCGFENSGKSTIISKLKNCLVFNFDGKPFGFPIPNTQLKEYTGLQNLIDFMLEKIKGYEAKYKKLPETVVIDTATKLYQQIINYNEKKYSNFEIHKNNLRDTNAFLDFIEKQLVPYVNVILVCHVVADETRHYIHSQGSFSKSGGWLSSVNESIYVTKDKVYLKSNMFPSRSMLQDIPDSVNAKDFDINKHMEALTKQIEVANNFEL